ncbi:MAG: phage baseplate assembly protein V [Candidatus Spyradenecus sp.]
MALLDFAGDADELMNLLGCLIKIGEVSSVDPAAGTARVVFDDDDGVVSYDLKVLHTNTLKTKDYAMPELGSDVLCVFLPNATEEGFILGSFYAGEVTPPESEGTKRTVRFSDGTRVCYDMATHALQVTGAARVTVQAPAITLDGNVAITGTLAVAGAVTADSTVTASGDVVGAGKSLETHTHTGNMGAPTSPPL